MIPAEWAAAEGARANAAATASPTIQSRVRAAPQRSRDHICWKNTVAVGTKFVGSASGVATCDRPSAPAERKEVCSAHDRGVPRLRGAAGRSVHLHVLRTVVSDPRQRQGAAAGGARLRGTLA